MKIALMHYHLNPGGVTTVIHRQARVLEDECDIMVLAGELPDRPTPFHAARVPGIAYDKAGEAPESPAMTARAVMDAIRSRWPDGCDVLHVHNPTLAKNRRLLEVLDILQREGVNLFLQVHDFAEDGRPNVYHRGDYPIDCHYGVINSRDYDILIEAGLSPEGLHLIPNAVHPPHNGESSSAHGKPFVVYPIRGLRRKNIGEALLLSLFFEKGDALAVTLPPTGPADMKSYSGWRYFSGQLDLNVLFDAGLKHNFTDLVHHAKFMLTTSISEGFGFTFLEPWTAGKQLLGRDLPEITRDFKASGVRLDHLYPCLFVPLSWIDPNAFRDRWLECVGRARRLFGFPPDEKGARDAFDRLCSGGAVDFSLLDESFQKKVISRAADERQRDNGLTKLNPFLAGFGKPNRREAKVETNKRIVMEAYHPDVTKKRLMEIYGKVVSGPVRHSIDKRCLLNRFLDPAAFSLLKWGEYVG